MRRAASLLPDPARLLEFVHSQANSDGGLRGRGGVSDLYYTLFGMECLIALGQSPDADRLTSYLRLFANGETLDLAHGASLVRCWTMLPADRLGDDLRAGLLKRLGSFRCDDGGYSLGPGETRGSGYGCFLALGAWQDLGVEPPDPETTIRFIQSLGSDGGGYGNWQSWPAVSTPSTAAAVTSLLHLGGEVRPATTDWLLSMHDASGGFLPWPSAPPDLLCTATAVHALAALGTDLSAIRQSCADFVISLQNAGGGFGGYAGDPVADCEFTYYALLTLGQLHAPEVAAAGGPSVGDDRLARDG